MSDTLISPEATAAIGRTVEVRTGVVYKKEFQRWAASVDDLNPLYFDEQFAKANGHPDVVMPPMFLGQVVNGVTFLDELRPDGMPARGDFGIPLPERIMGGGQEVYFYSQVYPGAELTSTRKLANIEEKEGRSGRFVLVTWETTFENREGELVAKIIESVIAR